MTEATPELEAIRQSLIGWRDDGAADPTIPVYADLTGDGIADIYGLDENDNLVIIPGATVDETVAVSTGGGIETDREDPSDG